MVVEYFERRNPLNLIAVYGLGKEFTPEHRELFLNRDIKLAGYGITREAFVLTNLVSLSNKKGNEKELVPVAIKKEEKEKLLNQFQQEGKKFVPTPVQVEVYEIKVSSDKKLEEHLKRLDIFHERLFRILDLPTDLTLERTTTIVDLVETDGTIKPYLRRRTEAWIYILTTNEDDRSRKTDNNLLKVRLFDKDIYTNEIEYLVKPHFTGLTEPVVEQVKYRYWLRDTLKKEIEQRGFVSKLIKSLGLSL